MATTPKVYVICDQNCKFEGMTKEQILTAIRQAVNEGTIGNIDAGFVQTVKTINGVALKFFVGEQSAYDALSDDDKKDLFAIITNDTAKDEILEAIEALRLSAESSAKAVEQFAKELGEVQGSIKTNASNISKNASNISKNASNISKNTSAITSINQEMANRANISGAANKIGALVMVYKVEAAGMFGYSLWETEDNLYKVVLNSGKIPPFAIVGENAAQNYSSNVSAVEAIGGVWVCLGATYKAADGNQLYLFQRIE